MSTIECRARGVQQITLLNYRPLHTRLDLWPWMILYAILVAAAGTQRVQATLAEYSYPLLCFIGGVAHVLCFLFEVWSVHWYAAVRCVASSGIESADCVLVQPDMHAGVPVVVPLRRNKGISVPASSSPSDPNQWLGRSQVTFEYQSCLFQLITRGSERWFERLGAPDTEAVTTYLEWKGWPSRDADAAKAKWGPNAINMPSPKFADLMLEHALAPFFVFQVACVLLWCLDDYWYYSLFTLSTLFMLEATLVFTRISQNRALRGMRPPPVAVYVYRSGMWAVRPSDELVPGDVVSVASRAAAVAAAAANKPGPTVDASAGLLCPADLLLLRGSAVVNEAMLTGESAPLVKDAISASTATEEAAATSSSGCDGGNGSISDDSSCSGSSAGAAVRQRPQQQQASARLNAFLPEGSRSHTRHVVFGGTTIMQAAPHSVSDAEDDDDANGTSTASSSNVGSHGHGHIPVPPDNGATAIVLRTGVYTAQGELMRTIQHATRKVTAGNWEAFVFILGLLVPALTSAYYVLENGWHDPLRNRWKLIMHSIMIVTSVVPPELPVELALAVNSSLAALAKRGIFCTEPWRITLAGKVDVAAFDKTGTLTSDEFTVNGVVLLRPPQAAAAPADATTTSSTAAAAAADCAVLVPAQSVPLATQHVLAGCHSVMAIESSPPPPPKPGAPVPSAAAAAAAAAPKLIGDPLERATLEAMKWTVTLEGTTIPAAAAAAASSASSSPSAASGVRCVKRWPFSATAKRMACAIVVPAQTWERERKGMPPPTAPHSSGSNVLESLALSSSRALRIVVKGAPEVIAPLLLGGPPAGYEETYEALTLTGARVLALGYRVLPLEITSHEVKKWSRAHAESGLSFAGFLVLSSPLKSDSARTIAELRESGHRVTMITGDAPFTAVAVAVQTGIITAPASGSSSSGKAGGINSSSGPPVLEDKGATAAAGGGGAKADDDDPRGAVWILQTAAVAATAAGVTVLAPVNGSGAPSTAAAAASVDADAVGLQWHVVRLPPRNAPHSSTTETVAAATAAIRMRNKDVISGDTSGDSTPTTAIAAAAGATSLAPFSLRGLCSPSAPVPPPRAHVCVTGGGLRALLLGGHHEGVLALAVRAAVFARVSPDQKEHIIVTLNAGESSSSSSSSGGGDGSSSTATATASGAASAAHGAAGRAAAARRRTYTTLMCGDGTNDVGALKQAAVGVSIISNPALESHYDAMRIRQAAAARNKAASAHAAKVTQLRAMLANNGPDSFVGKQVARALEAATSPAALAAVAAASAAQKTETVDDADVEELHALLRSEKASSTMIAAEAEAASGGGLNEMLLAKLAPPPPPSSAGGGTTGAVAVTPLDAAAARRAEVNAQLSAHLAKMTADSDSGAASFGGGGPIMVALGDASIASPFTSKLPSPAACTEILRQGRCTLVTTHQMYKILAINSLVLSYNLSVLYLHGVKSGDYQATLGGLSIAAFFMLISWAKPLKRLAPIRPHTSVFNPGLLVAIFGQFAVHLAVIYTAVALCKPYAAVDVMLSRAAMNVSDTSASGGTLTTEEATIAMRTLLAGGEWHRPMDAELMESEGLLMVGDDDESDDSAYGDNSSSLLSVNGSTGAALPSSAGETYSAAAASAGYDSASARSDNAAATAIDDEFGVPAAAVRIGDDGEPILAATAAVQQHHAATTAASGDDSDVKRRLLLAKKPKYGGGGSDSAGASSGPSPKPSPRPTLLEDLKFAPNIINTVVFLVSTAQQAATFLINYTGAPFMLPLGESTGLIRTGVITYTVIALSALGLPWALNALQLVELPTLEMKVSIIGLIVIDAVGCAVWERGARWIFGVGVPLALDY